MRYPGRERRGRSPRGPGGFRGERRHHPRRRRFAAEEYAYVLDYLRMGYPEDRHPWHRNSPVVQLIGDKHFTLMDATPRPGAEFEILERVYVGPDEELRVKIQRVYTDIEYSDLTAFARDTLRQAVEEIVRSREKEFVEFFNIAGPISLRFHSLELLPGVGKKTVARILEQREHKRFESFEDIKERTHIDPVKVLVERILEELAGDQKYYLFVRPPKREMEGPVPPIYLRYLEQVRRSLGGGRRAGGRGAGEGQP